MFAICLYGTRSCKRHNKEAALGKLGIVALVELPMSFDTSLLCKTLNSTNPYGGTVNGVNSL